MGAAHPVVGPEPLDIGQPQIGARVPEADDVAATRKEKTRPAVGGSIRKKAADGDSCHPVECAVMPSRVRSRCRSESLVIRRRNLAWRRPAPWHRGCEPASRPETGRAARRTRNAPGPSTSMECW